jgi:hypothetical protein
MFSQVLGSDGLYDHLSCGEICTFIQEHVKAGKSRETVAQALCQAVREFSATGGDLMVTGGGRTRMEEKSDNMNESDDNDDFLESELYLNQHFFHYKCLKTLI